MINFKGIVTVSGTMRIMTSATTTTTTTTMLVMIMMLMFEDDDNDDEAVGLGRGALLNIGARPKTSPWNLPRPLSTPLTFDFTHEQCRRTNRYIFHLY